LISLLFLQLAHWVTIDNAFTAIAICACVRSCDLRIGVKTKYIFGIRDLYFSSHYATCIGYDGD